MSDVVLTEAERKAIDRSGMTAYEDGKGGWLWRAATLDERVAVVERIVADRVREAEQRGAVQALRDAADGLEGRLGVEGTPKGLWEFRAWLRARADRPAGDER